MTSVPSVFVMMVSAVAILLIGSMLTNKTKANKKAVILLPEFLIFIIYSSLFIMYWFFGSLYHCLFHSQLSATLEAGSGIPLLPSFVPDLFS